MAVEFDTTQQKRPIKFKEQRDIDARNLEKQFEHLQQEITKLWAAIDKINQALP